MSKIYVLLFFAFGLAFAFALIAERNADELCVRGDAKPGYCMRLRNCSFVKELVNKEQKTKADRTYARQSTCPSRRNDTRYVCCEEKEKIDQAIDNLYKEDCGRFETELINNGHEIQLMSRPWMALLYFKTEDGTKGFTCGGTLINKRYVLTAAHCFHKQELLSVRLGEHNIKKEIDCKGLTFCAPPVEDINIERIFVHEKYSKRTHHYDIALVKLSRDVVFKRSISPICLPTTKTLQQKLNNITKFYVTGWGKTEFADFSDTPMETSINRTDPAVCRNSFRGRRIDSTHICAGGSQGDSCNGDSGGPLSYIVYFNDSQRFVQYGVVSFGSHNCSNALPGVYTNVKSYMRWIAYKIATK
ncbi:serine protease grass-like [Drosophila albomicans]|uniref:CLIP domain-containing serine protease n=1 Tax=Drosophila albomicans TaxID=7291 RepID=A0A6P8XET8_DROAB|nr:serine protease grass-like [Drosophila albomicans]